MTQRPLFRYVHPNGPIIEEHAWVDPEAAFAPHADKTGAIWLDSSDRLHQAARYSFIATTPYASYQNGPDELAVIDQDLRAHADLWADLPEDIDALLPPFRGGAAGYFGYDMGRESASIMPGFCVGFYDTVLAFDHHAKKCFLIATGLPESRPATRADRAHSQLAEWRKNLLGLPAAALPDPRPAPPLARAVRSNVTATDFQIGVQKVIDYILNGDIFQANLAQRFDAQLGPQDSGFAYYQRLRRASPSPFSSYACFDGWAMASASPERFLQCHNAKLETRPIKGTQPRGQNPAEDAAIAAKLMASEKDRAENIMIVDLLRNDLAKTCRDHSIEVPDLCALESFSNVHHLVSTVRGELAPNKTPLDALRASFPGGSITGAPKIRAMEIIDEMEPHRRGPSYGSLGYIGFDATMDVNIIIRTAMICGDELQFHVGGGIVADSQPALEYQETLNKAGGLLAALGVDMRSLPNTTEQGPIEQEQAS
jgi:para-aminobenzoate synthetase component 1